ncbi:MAG: hypothetical protein H3C36_02210 [Chitinophagaceae bacterium]|nr:hypothetical protein [Chitinophagaceae bacterium]
MALNKGILKNDIRGILNDLKTETDQEAAIEKFASMLSDAIDDYIKSAQVVGTDSTGGPITGELQ